MMFLNILSAEFLKLKRSRITWITWLAFSIMPLIGAMFMWIVMEPDRASSLGLLGTKAQIAGVTATWSGYFALLLQTTGIGGMILVSVIAAFVFGREYSEGTAKNLLTLPVARSWFVIAKYIVVLTWFGFLTVSLVIEGTGIAWAMKLPGYSASILQSYTSDIFLEVLIAWLIVPPVAWIATLGRGYLAPLGFTIFMLILGNVFGATGWGKWFPWSIVPLFAGVAGPRVEVLAASSVFVLLLTFCAGTTATFLQIRYGDNTQ